MSRDVAVNICVDEIRGPCSWTRATLRPRQWIVPVPEAACAELDAILPKIRERADPVDTLDPACFALTACRRVMAEVRERLVHGPGLAVVDRIPVERYSPAENRAIAWLLARTLGQVVDQKWGGTRLYDVKDSGQTLGYGVRRSVTNLGQPFHTDGPWLWKPPAFVGLFCLEEAASGGLSRFVSLVTAHNELRRRHPDLLARLYRPFHWDRQAEHPAEDRKFSTHPVFEWDGRDLTVRHYADYVEKGHALAGEPLDEPGRKALAAVEAIVDDPAHWIEFRVARGQLQYIDNRRFAHSRTGFQDGEAGRRHMIRIWNRDEGTPHIEGRPA